MRLICYPTSGEAPKIVPAPVQRAWMERTPNRFAYRCLPLNIANAHGWQILNAAPFSASWNGGGAIGDVSVVPATNEAPLAQSHFGSGVLTFTVAALFRTDPGYDLMVTGPLNEPKDGIQPLAGIVETDWAPYTFTMNWKFTREGLPVAFERNEPFCMIFPVKRGLLEEVEPEIRDMRQDKDVFEDYSAFAAGRAKFIADLGVPGSEAQLQQWQKNYFRGETRQRAAAPDHRTSVKLKAFREPR